MCSISGFLKIGKQDFPKLGRITEIIKKGESRGRDAFGYVIFNENQDPRSFRYNGPASDILNCENPFGSQIAGDYLLLNNNRAEPTTEFVQDKKLSDVQPYNVGNTWIVHNGTIANDKELIQKYDLKLQTRIDSAVIPHVFEKSDFSTESILEILKTELIGSYALAVYNTKYEKLVLATNYKPLSLLFDGEEQILYFSSLEQYMVEEDYNRIFKPESFIDVKPYTCLIIDRKTGKIEYHNLYREKSGTKKALICASSGMDSTVAATWAKKQGYEITLLHFQYQCRAQQREEESIRKIAEYLDAQLVTIPTDFFKGTLGGSKLYDETDITKEDEKGAELAIEWVPARNLIFLSIAAGYAEAKQIDYIVLGGNLEESGCLVNVEENLIRMSDGNFKMPADVEIGDMLLSWNFKTNKFEPSEVRHKFTPKKDFYYEIVCDGRQFKNRKSEEVRFFASSEHPFWVKDKGWLEVKDLEPGMVFLQYTNLKQKVLQSNTETNNGAFKDGNLVGDKNPMYGHIRSETCECWCGKIHPNNSKKISKTMKELVKDPDYIQKIKDSVKEYYESDEWLLNMREIQVSGSRERANKRIEELKKSGYDHWNLIPETNKKLSESISLAIQEGRLNPSNNTTRPTKTEQKFIDYFNEYNLPFEYKGDGQIWITSDGKHMNPDFVNKENKKIIEVTTIDFPFHTEEELFERKELFRKVGWDMMYLYDTDLKSPEILFETVKMYLNGFHNGLKIREIIVHHESAETYNFHCEPNNNFFVGKSGVLTHNSYPDNEYIFQKKFNDILPNSLNLQNRVEVLTPVANLMKREIVQMGLDIGAPLHLTWSCYENGELHCGKCGPCFMRKTAFKMLNKDEVIQYHE